MRQGEREWEWWCISNLPLAPPYKGTEFMLQDKVAVVTGASRGAGRAIAGVLGEAGAVVYVTGRTVRPRKGGQAHFAPQTPQNEPVPGVRGGAGVDGLPGTIEETAEEIMARGRAAVETEGTLTPARRERENEGHPPLAPPIKGGEIKMASHQGRGM